MCIYIYIYINIQRHVPSSGCSHVQWHVPKDCRLPSGFSLEPPAVVSNGCPHFCEFWRAMFCPDLRATYIYIYIYIYTYMCYRQHDRMTYDVSCVIYHTSHVTSAVTYIHVSQPFGSVRRALPPVVSLSSASIGIYKCCNTNNDIISISTSVTFCWSSAVSVILM